MECHPLGHTGLKVSTLCLGTMTWGEQNSKQDTFAQIVRAKTAEISFMDTVKVCPVPSRAETYVNTKRIIGNWFHRSGDHADWILAGKIAGPGNGISHMYDGNLKFNRQHTVAALNASLECLQTDWLDFYQLRWPERRTNFFGQPDYQHQEESFTSLEETLEVLDEQACTSRIRYIGLSNEISQGAMTFLRLIEERGQPRAISIQDPYNLLNCSSEVGLVEVATRGQCGLLTYSPTAFGIFSGKYADGARPANTRIDFYSRFTRYTNPQTEAARVRYVTLVHEHGLEPAQMVLAYVTSRPSVTSNIIGAISLEQLEANLGSADLRLDEEVFTGIDAIRREQPDLAP